MKICEIYANSFWEIRIRSTRANVLLSVYYVDWAFLFPNSQCKRENPKISIILYFIVYFTRLIISYVYLISVRYKVHVALSQKLIVWINTENRKIFTSSMYMYDTTRRDTLSSLAVRFYRNRNAGDKDLGLWARRDSLKWRCEFMYMQHEEYRALSVQL